MQIIEQKTLRRHFYRRADARYNTGKCTADVEKGDIKEAQGCNRGIAESN